MSALPQRSVVNEGFTRETFRQMVVSAAAASNLSVKQFYPIVVDGTIKEVDLVLGCSGYNLIVDLSYVSVLKLKDLVHKTGPNGKVLDVKDSLVQTYIESHASRTARKLRALQIVGKGGALATIESLEGRSQEAIDAHLKSIKLMGGSSGITEGYSFGVTLLGVANSFVVSSKTSGNKWKDRTDELLETAKGLPVNVLSRGMSGSETDIQLQSVTTELEASKRTLAANQKLIESLELELVETRKYMEVKEKELSSESGYEALKREHEKVVAKLKANEQELNRLRNSADVAMGSASVWADSVPDIAVGSAAVWADSVPTAEGSFETVKLQTQIARQDALIISLQQQLDVAVASSSEKLKAQLIDKEEDIAALQKEVEDAAAANAAEVEKLQSEIEAKESQIADLQKQLEAAGQDQIRLETKVSSFTHMIGDKSAEISRLEAELDVVRKSLAASKAKTDPNALSDRDSEIATLTATLAKREKKIAKLTDGVAQQNETIEEISKELDDATELIESYAAQIEKLKSDLAAASGSTASALSSKSTELERLQRELNAATTESASLQAQLTDVEKKYKKLKKKEKEAVATIAELTSRVEELEAKLEDEEEDAELDEQTANMEKKIHELTELVALKDEKIQSKQVALEEMENVIAELKDQLEAFKCVEVKDSGSESTIRELEEMIKSLTTESAQEKESIRKLELALAEAVESEKSKEDEYTSLLTQFDTLKAELDGVKTMNIDMIVELGTMRGEKDGLAEDLDKRKKKLKKKEKELEKLAKSVEDLNAEILSLKEEKDASKNELEGMYSQLQEAITKSEDLQDRINMMESQRGVISDAFEKMTAAMNGNVSLKGSSVDPARVA
ncbi:hypothetical protein HDU79_009531 [Rhizoclosmatium sp. JEL0117]|nr:hypothetical protein HDU79_009531 [Rhizoclosmatium sp. JEL0117]